MQEGTVAKLTAELGFKINQGTINKFEKLLNKTAASMEKLEQKFTSTFSKVEKGLASRQLAEKRDLDIQIRKLKIEQEQTKLRQITKKLEDVSRKQQIQFAQDQAKIDQANAKSKEANSKGQAAFLKNVQQMKLDSLNLEYAAKVKNLALDREALKVLQEQARLSAIKAAAESRTKLDQARANAIMQKAQSHSEWMSARTAAVGQRGASGGGGGGVGQRGGGGRGGHPSAAFGGGLLGYSLISGPHLAGAVGGFGIGYGLSQMNNLVNEINALTISLGSITGSASDAAKALDYLKSESNRLGFDYMAASSGYKSILAATAKTEIGAKGGQEIFSGLMSYFTAYGATEDQKSRGTNAVVQMLSKKRIYAEELTQQMSEAVPGAIQIFANALTGGDTEKLLKDMQSTKGLDSIKELPKVIAYMNDMVKKSGALEANAATLAFHQNRFHNSWLELFTLFKVNGFESGQAKIFKAMTGEMERSTEQAKKLGKVWDENITPVIVYAIEQMGQFARFAIDNPGQTALGATGIAALLGGAAGRARILSITSAIISRLPSIAGVLIAEDFIRTVLDPSVDSYTNDLAKRYTDVKVVLESVKSLIEWIANPPKPQDDGTGFWARIAAVGQYMQAIQGNALSQNGKPGNTLIGDTLSTIGTYTYSGLIGLGGLINPFNSNDDIRNQANAWNAYTESQRQLEYNNYLERMGYSRYSDGFMGGQSKAEGAVINATFNIDNSDGSTSTFNGVFNLPPNTDLTHTVPKIQ